MSPVTPKPSIAGNGQPAPLGVSLDGDGVNVAVASGSATAIWFCAFDRRGTRETARIPLTRTGDVFHGRIANVVTGARYGLRADGPWDPHNGLRFDPEKLLVDPYARTLDRPFTWSPDLARPRDSAVDTAPLVPKAIVTPMEASPPAKRPRLAAGSRVIYELGVKAFTMLHPEAPRRVRGTLPALAHPAVVAHLARLGITTVELMPIATWIDERHLPALGLANAWGYNPVVFQALDPRLAPNGIADLRRVADALHDAGIELILDVVFNHTGESDEFGATLSLRGLDNAGYYRLDPSDRARYNNDTGCGNTLALDREPGMSLVLDTLRYLATAGGVDGFRFDLATVLGRRDDGFDPQAPLLRAIGDDPLLRDLLMIAEPWDIGPGGHRLGVFPPGWSEWNDRYRDDVRRYWRGDAGARADLATRLAGSSDVFAERKPGPAASINFAAAHDGFSLADLVAYQRKHNEANGEGNRDGTDANYSWNNGIEGTSADPGILAARRRDMRALLATLFLSRGTPMLTAGDELGRTQAGNNNAYAQDNPVTWLDWKHADDDLAAFVAALIALRRRHPALHDDRFLTGAPLDDTDLPDVAWLDAGGSAMTVSDWQGASGDVLGMLLRHPGPPADRVLAVFNRGAGIADMVLPEPTRGRRWTVELSSAPDGAILTEGRLSVPPRSVVLAAEA